MLLEGLKMVELATWVAGFGAASIMADWGADVIKVESASGDFVRAYYPEDADGMGNPIFTLKNRGKRSLVHDVRAPDGRDTLLALLHEADVFVTNLRPGSLAPGRIDHPSIAADVPRLAYTSLSGYAVFEPHANLPALMAMLPL